MDKKQGDLQTILLALSKERLQSGESINKYLEKLGNIYTNDFRHLYSGIFGIITRIDGKDEFSLDVLQQNIGFLREKLSEDSGLSNLRPYLDKLYDHTNLEIARIGYTREIAKRIEDEYQATNEDLKKISAKAESMQKEYVTILGIFSSIVITFVAGMVFSSAVLNNVDKASIYRLVFVMLMVALLIFNLLYLLLNFIRRINNESQIYAELQTNDENSSVMTVINSIIFFMLVVDFILWLIYWYRFP